MELSTAGFHHIALVSADITRSVWFYRDLLGLHPHGGIECAGPDGYRLFAGDEGGTPGTLLGIIEAESSARGKSGVGGVHHFALGTSDDAALLRWKRRLSDAGVPVSGPYDRGYFTSIYFKDLDGQIVEIATEGPGYAIDEPAELLGREIMHPPQRIIAGYRDEAAIAALTHAERVDEITDDMKLTGIHHVSAISPGLDEAGAFYEEALGLRLVKKTVNRDSPDVPHWFWANYHDGVVEKGSAFTIFGAPSNWSSTRPGIGQTRNVAFRTPDSDALGEWRDRLLSRGLNVSTVTDLGPFQSIYFNAPDGLELQIATDTPGF